MNYSAKEAASLTGLTITTLHYYEKEGLLPKIRRSESGHREYTLENIEWIEMIKCLRAVDLPIREIKKYITLVVQGGGSMKGRMELAKSYKIEIERRMLDLQNSLTLINQKLQFYSSLAEDDNVENLTYQEEWKKFKRMCEEK